MRRGQRPHPGHRGPGRGPPASIAVGAAFDRGEDGDVLLTREGGHHRNRIAHAAWGRHRRRDIPRPGRSRPPGPGRRADRARPGARPAHRRRRARRRTHPARDGRGPAGRRRRRPRPRGGARHRRHGPGLLGHHQPGGLHRRRRGARAAGRLPRSPTWSSSSSTPPCSGSAPGRRASSRWSPRRSAARARTWSTRTASGSCSGSTSWPNWPRATSSPRRSPAGCRSTAPTTCTWTGGTSAPRCGSGASPPSWPPAARTGSTRSPSRSRSRRPRTTPPAGCAPTPAAGRPCPASPRAAKWPAPGCTAPTGWPPTPCWRGWSSPSGSPPT